MLKSMKYVTEKLMLTISRLICVLLGFFVVFRKASMLSTLFLRRFPKFSFETVLVFVGNKAGILHNIYNLL